MSKRWIHVKERYPEDGELVFYYFAVFDRVYPGAFEWSEGDDGEGGKFTLDCFYSKSGFLCGGDVLWWMPREEGDEVPPKPEGI